MQKFGLFNPFNSIQNLSIVYRIFYKKNINSMFILLLLLLLLKKLAMQGREREIDTLSVRRPQPHTTNL